MAATVYKIFSSTGMAPGVTWNFTWNNVPDGKAYAVSADPSYPGSYQEGYASTTELEITRFWRRTRIIQKPGSIGVDVEVHKDVLGQVKNVGGHTLNFDMYLVVFS
jgi:hypothetical protein